MIDKDKIIEHLQKGGFLFELECMNQFKKAGFDVEAALHYFDEKTERHREVDFVAYRNFLDGKNAFSFNVSLVVECKAHISPILAISADTQIDGILSSANLISSKNLNPLLKKVVENNDDSFTFGPRNIEPIHQNIFEFSTKGNGKDRVFESMMQSLSASLYLRDSSNKSDRRFGNIYIPVIVFDNSLFSIGREESEINVEQSNYLKASKFYAFDELNPLKIFHIVSNENIFEYAQKIFIEISDFYETYKTDILKIAKENPNSSGKGQYDIR